jgi:hypothetical protein
MSLEIISTVLGILGGLSAIVLWIAKARESDVTLTLTLQYLTKDLDRLRGELDDLRSQMHRSATHTGRRISLTRNVLFKLINHYNDPKRKNENFPFSDMKELED